MDKIKKNKSKKNLVVKDDSININKLDNQLNKLDNQLNKLDSKLNILDNKLDILNQVDIIKNSKTIDNTVKIDITNAPKKRGRKKKIIDSEDINQFTSNIKLDNLNTNNDKIIIEDKTNESNLENTGIKNKKITESENIQSENTESKKKIKVGLKDSNKDDKEEISSDENKNNLFLKELLTKQLKNVSSSKKLSYNDIKRISKFISLSIFDKDNCSLWTGYITNEKNQTKGTYINFYFNKKKIALHRLLYLNYIGEISNDEYIKFSCENKGKCCNINHMNKYSYNKNLNEVQEPVGKDAPINNNNNNNNNNNDTKLHINTDKKKLIVEF